ncbi:unnamed protein product [Toxocara canis]|uniref:Lipoprotein n=1 Tax=Toxocara canis TaxID=6265 RepID=A0A183V0P4_TOXCA|nr:unnamed protein product [Toxocara canis]
MNFCDRQSFAHSIAYGYHFDYARNRVGSGEWQVERVLWVAKTQMTAGWQNAGCPVIRNINIPS